MEVNSWTIHKSFDVIILSEDPLQWTSHYSQILFHSPWPGWSCWSHWKWSWSPEITLRCTPITMRTNQEGQLFTYTNTLAQKSILTGSTTCQWPSVRVELHPWFCGAVQNNRLKTQEQLVDFSPSKPHSITRSITLRCNCTTSVICLCPLWQFFMVTV